ncbi:MAG: GlxA family transcriptional regulator [Myxococcota bacterium]
MRSVVIVGYPDVQALDVVGPFEVFVGARRYVETDTWSQTGYEVAVATTTGDLIPTSTGVTFGTIALPDPRTVDTVVVPGGAGIMRALTDEVLLTWVRAAAAHARRFTTVCTGAFLAAEAGLLDGHEVTTHWAFAEQLAHRYPNVHVNANRMFVRSSKRTWTAAGISAGMDLALALVEADHGTEVAKSVARWLVLALRRPGGQGQFAGPAWSPRARRTGIRALQEAVEADPAAAHTVATLAERAAMSVRHFTRVFTDEVGEAPGAYVERVRMDAARRQLEETSDTVAVIATRCGFGTAESMRRNFIRRIGVSPKAYRKTFA